MGHPVYIKRNIMYNLKKKQAGAGAVPSSGLVDSWVKIYSFFVGDPKQETG